MGGGRRGGAMSFGCLQRTTAMASNDERSANDATATNANRDRPFPAAPELRFLDNPSPVAATATSSAPAPVASAEMPRRGQRKRQSMTSSTSGGECISPRDAWHRANAPARNPGAHFGAPYLDPFLYDTSEVGTYVVNGFLPGNLPDCAPRTRQYAFRFVLPLDMFAGRSDGERNTNRIAYLRQAFSRSSLADATRTCPERLGLDTWVLRHPHELATVEKLFKVVVPPGDTLSELISVDVLCYGRPLLQVNFRFLRAQRSTCGGQRSPGAMEGWLRSKYGVLADYSHR